ncbi:MAG: ubiquinone biosynthesis protein UbiH, partial [Gammaproteobacteria bacterium]
TRLLVGADGARSRVRQLAGIGERVRDYRQHALVATVRCEQPHGRAARQCFLPTGPLAFLPLDEPHTCAVVWSTVPEEAARLEDLEPGPFATELAAAFGRRLGAVELAGRRGRFPLVRGHAREYVRPRLALVGDAAHHIHPLAGQGANLGLMDVATLAHCLREARERGREDPGRLPTLRRYARWRRGENLKMIAAMDLFRELFGTSSPAVAALRGLGMKVAGTLPPVKEAIMLHAMGMEGDLPGEVRPARA